MKTILISICALLFVVIAAYFFGPKPQRPLYNTKFPRVPKLHKLESFIYSKESLQKLKPDNQAEIIWADSAKQQQQYAIVYLHGFSASKEEGNPTHLNLAKALNANLYLTRLADHGLDTVSPMEFLTADRLWESAKEALAIGEKLGKKVILMGTSTGGTLALQLAAAYPKKINSLVLISPNIEINDKNAWLLNNPWGLQIARTVLGSDERVVDGKDELYKKYWYTNYRVESLVALEELLESSMNAELFEKVKQPTLLLYYYKNNVEQDPVVRVDAMLRMFNELGSKRKEKIALPNVDSHVLGSYITSKDLPSVNKAMGNFIKDRLNEK